MAMAIRSRIVVREAEEHELDRVLEILRVANSEFERVLPPAFYRAYLANVLDLRSRLGRSQLFVAERGGDDRLVGAITLYPAAAEEGWGWPPQWAGIRAVAVEPSARGLGIGRCLTEVCIDRSRVLGSWTVCLHTAPFMQAAIRMYETLGFHRAPEFDGDAGVMFKSAATEPRIPALAYRLDLSARGAD